MQARAIAAGERQPLAGRTVFESARTPATALAVFVLGELGARARAGMEQVALSLEARHGLSLSAYGSRGRFAHGPEHDSAVEAVGGALMAQWTYHIGPAYLVTPYATIGQGLLAAAALLAGALRSGTSPTWISALQGLLAVQTGAYAFGPGRDPSRWNLSPRGQMATYSVYRAADDWLFIGASTMPFMLKVLNVTGLEDVLADPRLADGPQALRGSGMDAELRERIGTIIAGRTRDTWLAAFERAGVPAGPCLSIEEALAHPQIVAAGLAEPGTPIGRLRRPVTVTRVGEGRPRPAAAADARPLSGLRVVELAGYIAGPYCGRLLADLGADVIKIEPPDGDPFRTLGHGFVAWNYGKRSVALNLREAAGRGRLLDLVRDADILVTNYRPEAMARMGLGRDELLRVNPALVHCTVSAFGETGPLAHLPGFDPVIQAFAGILKRQGGDDEPVKPQIAATDYLSGMLATTGILAARLAQAEHSGGYIVSTSLLAAAMLLNYAAYEDLRAGRPYLRGGRDFPGPHPLNALHRTGDGWLLTVLPNAQPEAYPEALAYLAGGMMSASGATTDTTEAAINRLATLGVPAVPALAPDDLPSEPHHVENALWITLDQPGVGPITLPAPVLGQPPTFAPAPAVGEHTETAAWT